MALVEKPFLTCSRNGAAKATQYLGRRNTGAAYGLMASGVQHRVPVVACIRARESVLLKRIQKYRRRSVVIVVVIVASLFAVACAPTHTKEWDERVRKIPSLCAERQGVNCVRWVSQ